VTSLITIDGSRGEGGGQILRTSLGLSLATGRPFRIERIRAGREKPGLLRQHLTAVLAATEIGAARVAGAELGSEAVEFHPGAVRPGSYRFAIGTAGSATLVLQTVLPALLTAAEPTTLVLEGGTHNPFAPPVDFLERSFAPQVARLGARLEIRLERHGFFPAGGGRVALTITPAARLTPFELVARGASRGRRARALVALLSERIGERELGVVRARLGWEAEQCQVLSIRDSAGPGNALSLELEYEEVTEVLTAFGAKDRSSAAVAEDAVAQLGRYLSTPAPVGEHLADQLLVPLALAGGGRFVCGEPSSHARTNAEVIERFLPVRIAFEPGAGGTTEVRVERALTGR